MPGYLKHREPGWRRAINWFGKNEAGILELEIEKRYRGRPAKHTPRYQDETENDLHTIVGSAVSDCNSLTRLDDELRQLRNLAEALEAAVDRVQIEIFKDGYFGGLK